MVQKGETMNIAIKKISPKEGIVKIGQLRRLLRLVPKTRNVKMIERREDLPANGLMRVAMASQGLAFLADPREDIYSVRDLKVRYR